MDGIVVESQLGKAKHQQEESSPEAGCGPTFPRDFSLFRDRPLQRTKLKQDESSYSSNVCWAPRTSFFYSRTSRQKRGNWQTQIHLFKKGVSGYIYQKFNEVLHSVWKSLKISIVIFAFFGAEIEIL